MLQIEIISKSHNRAAFDCGDVELNNFLKRVARQHITKGISKTFVLVESAKPTEIIAYMTIVACEVYTEHIPDSWKRKYPRKVPAAKLARLAVAKNNQRKGYGELLLIDTMKKTLNVAKNMGIVGLFVDAKHEQAKMYYSQFGFISMPEQLDNLFLPLSALEKNMSS